MVYKELLKLREQCATKILYGEDVFDRLALFIYGIKETNYSAPPRKDGVLKGIDLSLTNRKISSNSDDDTKSKVDMLRLENLGVNVKFVYTIEHFTKRLELMPVKGKRNLTEIADILLTATKIFGKDNIFYYYIAGIDDFVSIKDNFIRFKPFGKPLISVLTPYNNQQFGLYFSANKVGIIKQLCKIRELVLQMWGKPIPLGSNRSLFALNADIV